jgi:K+-sensing histidine kinase KdpD
MFPVQQESFVPSFVPSRLPGPPRHVEVLAGVARDLMPAVWSLGVQCSVLRLPADLTARERALVDGVERSARRLARVLTGVHDLVAADGEGLALDRRPTRIDEVVDDALEQLRDAGVDAPIACEGDGDPDGTWDPERLAQAVSYLLECALECGPDGAPVRLAWSGAPAEVVLVVERPAAEGETDTGLDLEWGERVGGGPEDGVKAAVARRVVLAHGGTLARFAASGAIAYVAVLPRAPEDGED